MELLDLKQEDFIITPTARGKGFTLRWEHNRRHIITYWSMTDGYNREFKFTQCELIRDYLIKRLAKNTKPSRRTETIAVDNALETKNKPQVRIKTRRQDNGKT